MYDHDDKVAAVTTHYASILGHQDSMTWSFDLELLYTVRPKADEDALTVPFNEA